MRRIFFILIVFIYSIEFAQIQNVKINSPNNRRPNEVTIAVNPTNPNFIVAGSNLNYLYKSNDGGNTWSELIMSSTLGVWGDPVVIYDGLGNLYFGHLSDNRGTTTGYWIDRIVVQKSTDNGSSWSDGVGVGFSPPYKEQDKEWLAADMTNSNYKNNIYMAWTEFDDYGSSNPQDSSRIRFSRSTNSGGSWSEPIVISDNSGNCVDDDLTVEGAVPAIGPNGEVYVSWAGPVGIMFDKSTDGGLSFGTDIFVTSQPGGWAFDISGIYRCNGMPITLSDYGNSNYSGNVYVVWGEKPDGSNDADVFISTSTDGGNTWGNKVKVNNDNTSRPQFFPWAAIDQSTGKIYVVFYDRRNTTLVDTEVYLAVSDNGGTSFTNHKISDTLFAAQSSIFFGDYTNITALNGKIYPVWMRVDTANSEMLMSVLTSVIDDSELTNIIDSNEELVIKDYKLFQNYPNPFNPSTIISYQLLKRNYVKIEIVDILGNIVESLFEGTNDKGFYEIPFDGSNLSSGIYFYQIQTDDFVDTKKMLLLK